MEAAHGGGHGVSVSGGITIVSTRGPDDEPVCEFTWGPLQWYSPVDDVRETALDMFTCAAYAEMMRQMITEAGLPPRVVEQFTTHLLRGREKRFFGAKTTMELMPAGASNASGQRLAVVLLRRGSMNDALNAVAARAEALGWLAVAEATESDQLVSEALSALRIDDGTQERLFGYLRELRSEQC